MKQKLIKLMNLYLLILIIAEWGVAQFMNKKMLMNNGSINKHFHVIKEDFEDDNFNFNITGT